MTRKPRVDKCRILSFLVRYSVRRSAGCAPPFTLLTFDPSLAQYLVSPELGASRVSSSFAPSSTLAHESVCGAIVCSCQKNVQAAHVECFDQTSFTRPPPDITREPASGCELSQCSPRDHPSTELRTCAFLRWLLRSSRHPHRI